MPRYALQRRRKYESNRHCTPGRRPGADRDSEGDPQNTPNPRGRPVADIIDTVGEILFFYVGFGQKAGVVVVHSDDEWGVGIYKKKRHRPVGAQERPPGGFVFKKAEAFFDLIVVLFFKMCYSYNYL